MPLVTPVIFLIMYTYENITVFYKPAMTIWRKKCVKFIDSIMFIDNFILSEWSPFWVILSFIISINQCQSRNWLSFMSTWVHPRLLVMSMLLICLVFCIVLFIFLFAFVLCLECPMLLVCLNFSFLVSLYVFSKVLLNTKKLICRS